MKRIIKLALFLVIPILVGFTSGCKKNKDIVADIEKEETPPIDPKREVLVWVDAQSNIFQTRGRFRDKDDIKVILDSLKIVGVTGLVVDIKHNTGYTLYNSAHTGMLTSLDGLNLPENYVEFMISEAKARNLNIFLAINTFVWGNGARRRGVIYDDPEFKKYEAILCDVNGNRVTSTDFGANAFMNPASTVVQDRALNVIKEIATKFDIDGIVLDYCRYKDINADFSDLSKELFIQFLKEKFNDNDAKYMQFPKDIVSSWKSTDGVIEPNATGKYYQKWLYFRSSVLKSFMVKARAAVKSVKPNLKLGAYTGAWYNTYYKVGVNWASEEYDPFYDDDLTFSWAYPGYKETGYAEQLDLLMTGNYFRQLMLSDNPATVNLFYHWWSVEGSINGVQYVTKNKMPIYSSLDVGNVPYANEAEISNSIKYILNRSSGGLMLFDVVHITVPYYNNLKIPLWDAVENGIKGR